MLTRAFLAIAIVVLAGCSRSDADSAPVQVIVGAALIDASNRIAIPHSVVVVRDGKVQAAGPQSSVPVPRDSAKVNGSGKFLAAAREGEGVEVGKPADLLLLSADPAADPAFRSKVIRRMSAGRWVE